jgi:hypothetical protein
MSIRKVVRSFIILGMGTAQCAVGLTVCSADDVSPASEVAALPRVQPAVAKAQPRLLKNTSVPASPASTASTTSMQLGGAAGGGATLWRFMGIPQGIQKVRGATTNRRGNTPGREPTPALKSIADPANLQSGNPAIEAAAKIKQQEDMAPQKIKALKYLATIGCGCYDKVYDVKGAFMAALDDCTEDVRLQAAKSIGKAAESQCAKCSKSCCCTAEMMQKLNDVATKRDDEGCFVETSADVREAACEALMACRRRVRVYPAPPPMPVRTNESQPDVEMQPDLPQPPPSEASTTGPQPDLISEILGAPSPPAAAPTPGVQAKTVSSRTEREAAASRSASPAAPRGNSGSGSLVGTIVGINAKASTVDVQFDGRREPTVGSYFNIYHRYAFSTAYLGRLEIVYLADNGRAIARPTGRTDIARLGKGDHVSGRIVEGDEAETTIMTGVSRQTKKKPAVRSCVEPPTPAAPPEVPYLPDEPSPSDTDTTQTGGRLRAVFASWFKPQDEEVASAAEPAEPTDPSLTDSWRSLLKRKPAASSTASASEPSPAKTSDPSPGEPALMPQSARQARATRPAPTAPAGPGVALDLPASDVPAKRSSSKRAQPAKRSAPGVVLLED